ncbi:MAG: hypothetical protein WC523_04345 [Patescibacteria group bacterium]
MFKLENKEFVSLNFAKTHYVSSDDVATEVLHDLNSRFDTMIMSEISDKHCVWDPGGMLMMNDDVFEFDLGNIIIDCKAQHFNEFVVFIKDYKPRGNKIKYVKIHSNHSCICITPEEFDVLKFLVNNPDLEKKSAEVRAERMRRIQGLVDDGHLIQAVKDANGNIVDINKLAKKIPKDVN